MSRLSVSLAATALVSACVAASAAASAQVPLPSAPAGPQSASRPDRTDKAEKALAAALGKLEAQQPLTAADHLALKTAAKQRKIDQLRVCGDPGNLPLSNNKGEGYQNKIIDIVAAAMGARVSYFWRPYTERGLTRQTFDAAECEILLDMPTGYERMLTTQPIYRTAYVLAWRNDRGLAIESLDDPKLKTLRVGVFQTSAVRQALSRHGVTNVVVHTIAHDADTTLEHQPWQQVRKVVDGELDVAAVWGPFAGWLKATGAPIVVKPVNLMDDEIPLEFDLSLGLRNTDQILKYKFELALDERKAEIEKVLRDYGVPLVQCSRCYVAGDLPAHGIYAKVISSPDDRDPSKISADQKVTAERVSDWLASGADVNEELANAVLAGDAPRVTFLLGKGADIEKRDNQGYAPLHTAARTKSSRMVALLLASKANVNSRDSDGMTALLHAVARDDADTIRLLAKAGADLQATGPQGSVPLAVAIVEDKLAAAEALIAAGAPLETRSGADKLTPLMLVAGKEPIQFTLGAGRRPIEKIRPDYPGGLEIAKALIEKGADVNAVSGTGLTALMLAAAHNQSPIVGLLLQSGARHDDKAPDGRTALDLAKANGNEQVVSLMRLLGQSGNN